MALRHIMIMAGGTGGHVYPALAVAHACRDQGIRVSWIGTPESFESRVVTEAGFEFITVSIRGIRGQGLKRLVRAPFQIATAISKLLVILKQQNPQLVLGMGGYVSGPGGVAAWIARIPLVIHEQNAVPGLTNRLLANLARRVLCGFPNAFSEKFAEKMQVVGNPVRQEIEQVPAPQERMSGRQGALRLLVLGGSQGAQALNEVVPRAVALSGIELEVRHQAGKGKADNTRKAYELSGVGHGYQVDEFIDDMAAAYEWADVIVCRSGALTIAEITVVGLGAILVPFPHAVDDHQAKNGQLLVEKGAAVMIRQESLTPECLAEKIERLNSREYLIEMAAKAHALGKKQVARRILDICREVAQ